MKNTSVRIFLAAAALAVTGAAQAQTAPAAYVGLGFGSTHLNTDCTGTASCSNSSSGFKFYGGYKFAPGLAGEIVYLGMGKAKATLPNGGSFLNGEIKTTAMGVGGAFSFDLSPSWLGVARLGVARVKTDVSVSQGTLSATDGNTSTQAYFGLAVGYRITPALSLDLSADFTRTKFDEETGNVRLLGVGLTYAF
jgi:hypothetical protein